MYTAIILIIFVLFHLLFLLVSHDVSCVQCPCHFNKNKPQVRTELGMESPYHDLWCVSNLEMFIKGFTKLGLKCEFQGVFQFRSRQTTMQIFFLFFCVCVTPHMGLCFQEEGKLQKDSTKSCLQLTTFYPLHFSAPS